MAKASYLPHKVCLGCQEDLPESKFRFIRNPKTGKGSVLSDYCQNCDRTSGNNELAGELCARQLVGESPPANERRPSTSRSKLLSDGVPTAESNGATLGERFPEPIDAQAGTPRMSFEAFCEAWRSGTLDSVLVGHALKSLATAMANNYLDRLSKESKTA